MTLWSDERLRDEIRRWRAYDYSTQEILDALRDNTPDMAGVASPQQINMLRTEIQAGQL